MNKCGSRKLFQGFSNGYLTLSGVVRSPIKIISNFIMHFLYLKFKFCKEGECGPPDTPPPPPRSPHDEH